VLTLYQAEWCPFSSAVRQVLTELGVDFVARQAEPWPEDRDGLSERAGSDEIPTLETEDGRFFSGTRAIFAFLHDFEPGLHAATHRERFHEHLPARESDAAGHLIEYFRSTGELQQTSETNPEQAEVVHVPEASRYELRLDGRLIGLAAYHRSDRRLAVTHTEVDPSCEGRGFGSRLVAAVLDDARAGGLEVLPLCPFVGYYVRQHPEYADLLPSGYRRR
jgi:predicted GNAT family acetyltransferase/glutaredoxin